MTLKFFYFFNSTFACFLTVDNPDDVDNTDFVDNPDIVDSLEMVDNLNIVEIPFILYNILYNFNISMKMFHGVWDTFQIKKVFC